MNQWAASSIDWDNGLIYFLWNEEYTNFDENEVVIFPNSVAVSDKNCEKIILDALTTLMLDQIV